MTNYYVGPGGNNGNDGTTWALRRLTLNSAEDLLSAGDTLYIGPGTYRETWTIDTSGAAGSVIAAIGDVTGANTDGVGGVVRITGSDNDQTNARASCITATTKSYRSFAGILVDMGGNGGIIMLDTSCTNITFSECVIGGVVAAADGQVYVRGASQANITFDGCLFNGCGSNSLIFTHSADVDNTGHVVQNCLFLGPATSSTTAAISIANVGGITIKNSGFLMCAYAVYITAALAAGQTVTVNNCLLMGCGNGLRAATLGEIVENYNAVHCCATARTNVATGANSNAYPWLQDWRWFLELTNGGRIVSPYDLVSYSTLLNVAGTSPTTTDMRGTSVQGAQREWGALEYDSTLLVEGAGGGMLKAEKRGGKQ